MGKKNKKTEKAMELTAAEQTIKVAPAAALPADDTARSCWVAVALGVVFLFIICAVAGFAVKWVTMVLLVGAIVVLLWRGKTLRERMSWLTVAVALFVLMDGISTLYARSGKFALYEFLKVAAAACIFSFFIAFEPKKQQMVGHCAAIVLEIAGALASLISIDSISTHVLYNCFLKVISVFNASIATIEPIADRRLVTIFENPNVFSGAIGVCILLSLGLANSKESKKLRYLHLSCAVCSSIAFLLALSRGAIAAIGLALLLCILVERGEQRASMIMIMLNVFLVTGCAVVLIYYIWFSDGNDVGVGPLLLVIVAVGVICVIDKRIVRKFSTLLGRHVKTLNGILLGLLTIIVAFAVIALNLTQEAKLDAGEQLRRAKALPPGEYTLRLEKSGEIALHIYCLTAEGAMMDDITTLYSRYVDDNIDEVSFTVPQDSQIVYFKFYTVENKAIITKALYEGQSSGEIPLRYTLLPEMVAMRLQEPLRSHSFTQRTVYWKDGFELWKTSPVFGLGMGSFENAIISVQTYHYESKYAHSHYIQTLVEVGAVGFLLWLSILGTSAAAVFRMWRRKENAHPMTAACGAVLLFMMIHAAVEVDFSAGYFLPFGFGAFAVIDLCCGETLPVKQMSETAKMWVLRGEAAALGVFAILLGMNLQAKAISQNATYESLAKAAKMDKYEWADYALSYVYSASGEESVTLDMRANMDRFLPKLEAQNSNTIPFYLALTYFNLGEQEKAYEMLNKYVDYTASNSQHWEDSFQAALNYYDGSETSRTELKALYSKFNAWNEENLGTVEISDELKELLDALAA